MSVELTLFFDGASSTAAPAAIVQASAASNTSSQEWDIVTAGNGYYTIVDDASGLVLAAVPGPSGSADTIQQEAASSTNVDWITAANMNQMWQVIPVHIVTASTPAALVFDPAPVASIDTGGNPGTVTVELENAAGVLTGSTSPSVTLTITGPGSFSQTDTVTSSAGMASFDLSNVVLTTAGTYSISATSTGLTIASASLTVTALSATATSTVLTAPAAGAAGSSVTLTATVTGVSGTPMPTGAVTFLDGATVLGSGNHNSSDVATLATSSLPVGSNSLTAIYAGDTSNAPSTSNAVLVTITAAPGFAISLSRECVDQQRQYRDIDRQHHSSQRVCCSNIPCLLRPAIACVPHF